MFFKTLKQNYSVLTEDDLVICYYLYLKLTNPEIAKTLNKTVRAIESKRYRIGKKLQIANKNTTLIDTINDCYQ